jgi:hypothetical protein
MNSVTVIAGSCKDIPLQSFVDGGNRVKAAYPNGSLDTLTGFVFWGRSTTALFLPAITWYGAPGLTGIATQTGYDQGMILASYTNAQGAMLVPNSPYTLVAWWSPAAVPSKNVPIVRIKLIVEAPQIY